MPRRVLLLPLAFLTGVPALGAQQVDERGDFARTPVLEHGSSVERSIGAGEVHAYAVSVDAGLVLHVAVEQHDVSVAVEVYGPDGAKLVEVDSTFAFGLPDVTDLAAAHAGAYRVEVRHIWGGPDGRYELRVAIRQRSDHEAILAARRAGAEEARAWIREHAIPLETVEAGHGFADLEPLRDIVGDARIVALGEATHGTREFFQLKHRIFEFLVVELGFDVFAIEATLPEAMDVNRYVLTGEGDPARALAGMYFWTWDTEEVLELIHWMRRYNADPRNERKVSFYGVDMRYTPRAARAVLDYLRRVDPAAAATAGPLLYPLADPFVARHVGDWPEARRHELLASVRELAAGFDARRREYSDWTSAAEWDLARRHLHVLEQASNMHSAADGGWARDSAMAANLAWILEREGPASRAVLWAHNYHVGTLGETTGRQLREWFGEALRVFGFAFERGGFQARDFQVDGRLRPFRVGPAPDGSLDALLAAAGLTLAALDLRQVPEIGPVAAWFAQPRIGRNVGSGYSERNPEWYFWRLRAPEIYDALLFVRETSAARANPLGRRPGAVPPSRIPVNLDFEQGRPGDPPPGWTLASGIAGVEWDVALTREDARLGTQSVLIRRAHDDPYGETAGELRQRVDAAPWRGRRVALAASVRIEGETRESRGYLWLEVTAPGEPWSRRVFYDAMLDRPITSPEWAEYEIAADVPEDADVIAFGFAFVGPGRAWLDAVSLEPASLPDRD